MRVKVIGDRRAELLPIPIWFEESVWFARKKDLGTEFYVHPSGFFIFT